MERAAHSEVILCVREGMPSDARALRAAAAVITMEGNLFTNTAILCRGMGKPCITCAKNMTLDLRGGQVVLVSSTTGDMLRAGDVVTVDGSSGKIFTGLQATVSMIDDPDFQTVLSWADKFRTMRVETTVRSRNHTLERIQLGRRMGADGFGSVATDGMFFHSEDRLNLTRSILVHRGQIEALKPLQMLGELQKQDLLAIFREVQGRPIGVKLLDRHLGSFLPTENNEMVTVAASINVPVASIKRAIFLMKDKNPDMGLRGCRITAYYPEITEMQIRAIISAALELICEGIHVVPKILISMVCTSHELDAMGELINRIAFQVYQEYAEKNERIGAVSQFFTIGAIFNSPRACLRAETMASKVSHVAFNTKDLTMQVFGCDREDAEKFFPRYVYDKIYMVSQASMLSQLCFSFSSVDLNEILIFS